VCLLPRRGLGQPGREPAVFLAPPRDPAPSIENRPEPAADGATLETPVGQGIEVIARDPAAAMGRVPAGDEEPLQPDWDRTRHGLRRPHSRPWTFLCDGEFREAAPLGRLECQDDAVLRDPGLEELRSDPMLQPIALDPQLPVDDVDVDQAAVDPLLIIPTDVHQDIPIAGAVEDSLAPKISMRVWD